MATESSVTEPRSHRSTATGIDIRRHAGTILNAANALTTQDLFTREQVAYLIHLAYESGRAARFREDLAEVVTADTPPLVHRTHEQAIAARRAELDAYAPEREWQGLAS